MLILPAHVLRDLLAGTVLAASRDKTMPVLHSVLLRAEQHGDGPATLLAVATDRYRIHEGRTQAHLGADDAPFEALVDRLDALALVKLLPRAPKRGTAGPSAALEVDSSKLVVTVEGAMHIIDTVDRTYPRVEALWPGEDQHADYGEITLDPALAADVTKVPLGTSRERSYWTFRFTATKRGPGPVLAAPAGGHEHPLIGWRLLIMPIRLGDDGRVR
jgi:DNA polymerase III sliding clamp (beta) subunit (PCNA family)